MNDDRVILAKCVLGILGTLGTLLCIRRRLLRSLSWSSFTQVTLALLLATRMVVYIVVFLFLDLPAQSDVAGAYYPQAKAALSGLLPYRDFPSSYGPMFSYLAALPLLVWDSPKSIILLTIVFEILSFLLWMRILGMAADAEVARHAAWLYLFSAFPLWNVAILGQNQVWVSALLALSILLAVAYRPISSGLTFALSIIFVKFLSGIFLPGVVSFTKKPVQWISAFGLSLVAAYGICYAFGLDILLPIKGEGLDATSGNIWYLLSVLGLEISRPWLHLGCNILAGLAVLLAYWIIIARRKCVFLSDVILTMCLVFLVFLSVSKKAYTNYVEMIFLPLCFALSATIRCRGSEFLRLLLFGFLNIVWLCEPSLWFRWMHNQNLSVLTDLMATGTRAYGYIFLAVDLLLLAGYIWLISELAWLLFKSQFCPSIADIHEAGLPRAKL
jgi:hypothetical protein